MPWFMSTQTGVIWEQETLTKKMHPPQWSMDKPMVYFFFFLLSCILIFCLWGWGCWDRVSLQTLISICLCFQSAWIKGTHHHAQLTHLFDGVGGPGSPWAVSSLGMVVLSALRKETEITMGNKTISNIPPWTQPLGSSCLDFPGWCKLEDEANPFTAMETTTMTLKTLDL